MTRSQTNAVNALIAKLDAGVEWPDALCLISDQHNIDVDTLRYLYDYATSIDTMERGA